MKVMMKSAQILTMLLVLGAAVTPVDGDVAPVPVSVAPVPATTTPSGVAPVPVSVAPKPGAKPGLKPGAKLPRKPAIKKAVRKAAKPARKLPPPWKAFSLNPATRVKLDFRNASVDAVIHVLSQASGIPIIKDPALVGGVTLQSPKPQSLGDAFSMFNAILGLKNYAITRQGNFLLIAARAAPPGSPSGAPHGVPPPGMAHVGGPPTPGQPGGPPAPGGAASTDMVLHIYAIRYASATEVARVVTEVFGNPPPPPQPGYFPPPQQPANPGNKPAIKASAEDFSNSLIVYAPAAQQVDIAKFVAQIDKPNDQPQEPRVFKLQYALAQDLASVIQNVLDDSTPLGRGGTTAAKKDQNPNRPFYFFGENDTSKPSGGTVIADTRTNSLVVTATKENLEHVALVLAQLDQPATFQSTTWVYAFKNARADVVANLLNQSFGNKTTNGPVGGSLTNTGLNQNTGSRTGQTNTDNGGSSQPPSLQANANRPDNGENPNFNFRSEGNSFGSQNQKTRTTGLDSAGHVVNVRSLTGEVLLVPNIDTNSVIVVSPPEDRAVVEAILLQMDEIPKQVMIETLVVEANLDKSHQLGVEFNVTQNNPFGGLHGTTTGTQSFGLQGNTNQPQGLRYTLSAGQYQLFLQAVQTDHRFNVLSTPRIFTTNNATAQINISQSLPYVTNQTVTTTGTVLYNYNFLNVGIVLTVTPRITSNGYVTMDVTQTANDFVSYTSFNAPIVNQREAQTTVSVKDGETVVLGGIINDSVSKTVSKVPLLGDLPIIGNLFRSTSKSNNKTELLVFLTPRVVRDPDEARRVREQTEAELGKTAQQMLPAAQKPMEGISPK